MYIETKIASSLRLGGIRTFCPLGYFWAWVFRAFWLKESEKTHKDFEL